MILFDDWERALENNPLEKITDIHERGSVFGKHNVC